MLMLYTLYLPPYTFYSAEAADFLESPLLALKIALF